MQRIICLLIFLLSVVTCSASAKELQIWIVDENFMLIDEIFEGEEFGVYVSDADDPSHYPLSNLTIIFNDEEIHVDENDPSTYPVCYLHAPEVTKDTVMYITAKKMGYKDSVREISILNKKKLYIYLLSKVKGGSYIDVLIKDENEEPVPDVNVKLIFEGREIYSAYTNDSGMSALPIPKVHEEKKILIIASKEGYKPAKLEKAIEYSSNSLSLPPGILPLIGVIGIVIFIFAGVIKYVRREGEMAEQEELHGDLEVKKGMEDQLKKIRESKPIRRSIKIEEITIRKPEIQVGSKPKKEKARFYTEITKRKAKPDEWALGKDSVIAKIDEKLGSKPKVDANQWLTGKEDIISKIDEKLKKYKKKKD